MARRVLVISERQRLSVRRMFKRVTHKPLTNLQHGSPSSACGSKTPEGIDVAPDLGSGP